MKVYFSTPFSLKSFQWEMDHIILLMSSTRFFSIISYHEINMSVQTVCWRHSRAAQLIDINPKNLPPRARPIPYDTTRKLLIQKR